MFIWRRSETVATTASASQVWRIWSDVANWPTWDSELEWVTLDGPFAAGSDGEMQPKGGPKTSFTLTRVVLDEEFVDRARLPLTDLEFRHSYRRDGAAGGRITHGIVMTGLLAPLFGLAIGVGLAKHLRAAMLALSDKAAAAPP